MRAVRWRARTRTTPHEQGTGKVCLGDVKVRGMKQARTPGSSVPPSASTEGDYTMNILETAALPRNEPFEEWADDDVVDDTLIQPSSYARIGGGYLDEEDPEEEDCGGSWDSDCELNAKAA